MNMDFYTLFITKGLTVCVTRAGAGGGTPSDWKKAEAWKMLENGAESPASGARFVGTLLTWEVTLQFYQHIF
jgi:hypothetical protein